MCSSSSGRACDPMEMHFGRKEGDGFRLGGYVVGSNCEGSVPLWRVIHTLRTILIIRTLFEFLPPPPLPLSTI